MKIDPALGRLLSDGGRKARLSKLTFEEHLNRMYSKIQSQAIINRVNFKNTNYDLDTQVSQFMSGREMRMMKEVARRREQEYAIDMVPPSDTEDSNAMTPAERAAEEKYRLKELFAQFPMRKTRYDEDCLDMCIPGTEPISQAEYDDIVYDPMKVDQLA